MAQILKELRKRLRGSNARVDVEYACSGTTILLPADHKLPEYQRLHPLYDRFLPHLAHHLPARATIIDVGANVGDTLASMVGGAPQARYVCIEPDPEFFHRLQANAERVRRSAPSASVTCHQALIGREVASAVLEGSDGSRHAVPGSGGMRSVTLDELAGELALGSITLLKSDVDGYDYDVLAAADQIIRIQQPLLFFECQPLDARQHEGFRQQLLRLSQEGYLHFGVFDNFGQLMLRSSEPDAMLQLLEYTWRQTSQPSTRTVYYLDVLAATDRYAALFDAALRSYASAAGAA
jgi:FkbM family methyltransferase